MKEYFISGNVPALKNGKIFTGKYLVSSPRIKAYLSYHGIKTYSSRKKEIIHLNKSQSNFEFRTVAMQIKEELDKLVPPYKLAFHFVRQSKHKFDFGNACEIISDVFTAYDVWEDDNMDYFIPFPLEIKGKFYTYNKEQSGVIIKILE